MVMLYEIYKLINKTNAYTSKKIILLSPKYQEHIKMIENTKFKKTPLAWEHKSNILSNYFNELEQKEFPL